MKVGYVLDRRIPNSLIFVSRAIHAGAKSSRLTRSFNQTKQKDNSHLR